MKNSGMYFKIGLFILVGMILLVSGIVMLGAGVFDKDKILFETYFDESVQGLNVGSPVKYRGVQIGSVDEITFVGEEYDLEDDHAYKYGRYVMIKLAIERDILGNTTEKEINEIMDRFVREDGLRIRLAYLGVTGLAYLELDFVNPSQIKPLVICWQPQSTYVPSVTNTIARMEDSVNDLINALDSDFFPLLKNISEASENIPSLTKELNTTLISVRAIIEDQKANLSEAGDNVRVMTNDLKELVSLLKQSPSRIVFGGKPPKSELMKHE